MSESPLRLKAPEFFVLTLMRLWLQAKDGEPAEQALRQGFMGAGLNGQAAGALETVLMVLGSGKRPLRLAPANSVYVTGDEVRLLVMLAAAQGGDSEGLEEYLPRWAEHDAARHAGAAASLFAAALHGVGLRLRSGAELMASFGFGTWAASSEVVLAPRLALAQAA